MHKNCNPEVLVAFCKNRAKKGLSIIRILLDMRSMGLDFDRLELISWDLMKIYCPTYEPTKIIKSIKIHENRA